MQQLLYTLSYYLLLILNILHKHVTQYMPPIFGCGYFFVKCDEVNHFKVKIFTTIYEKDTNAGKALHYTVDFT